MTRNLKDRRAILDTGHSKSQQGIVLLGKCWKLSTLEFVMCSGVVVEDKANVFGKD